MFAVILAALAWLILIMILIPFSARGEVFNFDTAKLNWNWSQGTGGAATEFRTKCGVSAGGPYSFITALPLSGFPAGPSYSVQINKILASPGVYFCVVTAAIVSPQGELESGPSNEVQAGLQKGSPSPTGATFTAQ